MVYQYAQWGKKNDLMNNWAYTFQRVVTTELGNIFECIEHCGGNIQD